MLVFTFLSFFIMMFSASVSLFCLFSSIFLFFLLKFSGNYMHLWMFFLDKFSFLMFLLTCWVVFILFFFSFKYEKNNLGKLQLCLFLLSFSLFYSFFYSDLLGFYIFFELSLVPLLLIIIGWGYQVERVSASFYLFIYTLVGSFPLLLVLMIFKFKEGSLLWWKLLTSYSTFDFFCYLFVLVFVFSFMIKLPMYLLHLWLPKAHVEAPAVGSMILAAILLKLSAYGFYRVMPLVKSMLFIYKDFFLSILLYGALLAAIICLVQGDLKALIAYSSISHMGFMMGGILVQDLFVMQGVWVILLSHAFCSSALFFLANFNYEQNLSRQLLIVRGQGHFFYYIAMFWVLFLFINFSVPPFLNLMGELEITMALFSFSWGYFLILGVLMFFVAAYCVYCFSVLVHGVSSPAMALKGEYDLSFLVLFFHICPLIFLVLKMDMVY